MTDPARVAAISQQDIETVEALAQLGSAQFASDLRAVLDAARAVSLSRQVRHMHIDVSLDFETWGPSPLDDMDIHLCQCELCDHPRVSVAWKEQVLDASKIRRAIGGIAVAGEQGNQAEKKPWAAGGLQGLPDENLRRLVEVTRNLDNSDAVRSLADAVRTLLVFAPVQYLGFYLIVDVVGAREVTDVGVHWCTRDDCEMEAAVGRRRPRTLGSHGLPDTQRLCGRSSEHVYRSRS